MWQFKVFKRCSYKTCLFTSPILMFFSGSCQAGSVAVEQLRRNLLGENTHQCYFFCCKYINIIILTLSRCVIRLKAYTCAQHKTTKTLLHHGMNMPIQQSSVNVLLHLSSTSKGGYPTAPCRLDHGQLGEEPSRSSPCLSWSLMQLGGAWCSHSVSAGRFQPRSPSSPAPPPEP